MKVSLRWLESFLDLPTTDHAEIATVLANIGHEVEGFEVLEPAFKWGAWCRLGRTPTRTRFGSAR